VSELAGATATELLELFAAGAASPVEVVEDVLARIDRVEPAVQAVATLVADQARAAARVSEQRWRTGEARALEGVPYGLKDVVATAGVRTSGGSRRFADHVPDASATVARRLEAAGGVLVAKLNTYELALGTPDDVPYARNPWDVERTPGGSSSGSAAAVAARELPLAIGTDTGGSIRIPASFCGVTGFKPTYGVVPRTGVFPLSWTLDHVGPLATSALDSALVMDAIAGPDGSDPTATAKPWPPTELARRDDLTGVRIGVPRDWFFDVCDPQVAAATERAVAVLADHGAAVIDVSVPAAPLADERGMWDAIVYAECGSLHEDAFPAHAGLYGADFRHVLLTAPSVSALEYLAALRGRVHIQRDLEAAFATADVLVTPCAVAAAPLAADMVMEVGDRRYPWREVAGRTTAIFNLAGVPAISLPIGLDARGLPMGMQVVAPPHADGLCLRVGAWFQRLTTHHRAVPRLSAG
jgi:aspartyl-tRNA(Asn)/glutamyl-tRNA(Gln) amidotransferase subunit A